MIKIQDKVSTYGNAVFITVKVTFFAFLAPFVLAFICLGLAGQGLASGGGSCDCHDICKSFLIFLGADFGIVYFFGNLANYIVCCLLLRNFIELKGFIKVFENSDSYTKIIIESIMDLINLDFKYSLAIVILMSTSLFFIIVSGIYSIFNRISQMRKFKSKLQNIEFNVYLEYEENEEKEENENTN